MTRLISITPLFKRAPLLTLLIGLAATLVFWRMLNAGFNEQARRNFDDKSEKIVLQLVDWVDDHEHLLFGVQGMFSVSKAVTREEWRRYVVSLKLREHHPGVLGLGYAAWLTSGEKEAHQEKIRREGPADYRIRPEGVRPLYAPVTYFEPHNASSRQVFGYDMYSEVTRRAALDWSRDSGKVSLVSGIVLVQDPKGEKQPGLLLCLPVYRRGAPVSTVGERRTALQGFIYSASLVKGFVYGILGKLPDDIAFEIYDGESVLRDNLQFSSLKNEKVSLPGDYRPELTMTRTVAMHGRSWTFVFKSLPAFDREFRRTTSSAALAGGILISLLLSIIAYTMQRTRDRALELALSMTQNLSESKEKVRLILDTAGAAIYGMDTAGLCTFCNPVGLRRLGYGSEEELLGRNMHSLIHHSRSDGTAYPLEECPIGALLEGSAGCHVEDDQFWRSDGSGFPVEYWALPQVKDGVLCGVVISFIDISRRRKVEEELRSYQQLLELYNEALENRVADEVGKNRAKDQTLMQSEKLASIGQLAAGVAHEINNPVCYIISNLDLLTQYTDQIVRYDLLLQGHCRELSPSTRELIKKERELLDMEYILTSGVALVAESLEGAERVSKIVRDLKTFSRIGGEERELTDLNRCLESALTIVYNELKYVATVRKEYGDLPEILCNPGQLNQVFLNLLVNAGHAIVGQGEIVLRSWCDGEFVHVSVSDTGEGIPEEIRCRLFEPFFTTKEVGRGTGLGLSISHEIMEKHEGKLLVASEVGVGSTFTVSLPRTPREAA